MKNSIEFWHDVCMEVVRRDFSKKPSGAAASPDQGGPTRTSRALAIAHLAMHDAFFGTTTPASTYLSKVTVALPVPTLPVSVDSAIAGAAAACLLVTHPQHAAYIKDMAATFVDPSPAAGAATNGLAYGAAIAAALITHRANDGSKSQMKSNPLTAYGHHRLDPFDSGQGFLTPQWGAVTHFCNVATVPLAPPPGAGMADYLSDPDYRRDFVEVKDDGALISTSRTPDQWAIGHYWGYDGANDIGVPPRLYNQIARAWLAAHPPTTQARAVKLLAMINTGMANAAIDSWHHKYVYDLWRPVIGIREASKSTGPTAVPGPKANATPGADVGDPAWSPLGLPVSNEPDRRARSRTPGFPAYPSGHATFGATLFQIMQLFAGGAAITLQDVLDAQAGGPDVPAQAFDFVSDELDGKTVDADGSQRTRHRREYKNFARPIWENSISRVYLGVHWRFDGMPRADVAGKRYGGVPLGLEIGQQTFNFF